MDGNDGTNGTSGSTKSKRGQLIGGELARTSRMRSRHAAAATEDPYQEEPNAACAEVGLDDEVDVELVQEGDRPWPQWLWARVAAEQVPEGASGVRSAIGAAKACTEPDPRLVASAANAILLAVTPVAEVLASRVTDLMPKLQAPPANADSAIMPGPLNGALADDAFIDQRSGLVDKRMYLRMARRGDFPSRKQGRSILARWGDVKAALQPPPSSPTVGAVPAQPADELEQYRRAMGLAPKARKQG